MWGVVIPLDGKSVVAQKRRFCKRHWSGHEKKVSEEPNWCWQAYVVWGTALGVNTVGTVHSLQPDIAVHGWFRLQLLKSVRKQQKIKSSQ